MRIGDLAAVTGLSRDAIRFYEKAGLLDSARLANGYRDFPPEAVAWLHYVRTAQALGLTLAEIARHGERLRDSPDAEAGLTALLAEKIAVIDERVAGLLALRADIAERVDSGCALRRRETTVPEAARLLR